MLEKAATIKRFQYSPLCSEVKKQTDIAKSYYQVYESNEINKKPTLKKKKKSDLIINIINTVFTNIVILINLMAFLLSQNIRSHLIDEKLEKVTQKTSELYNELLKMYSKEYENFLSSKSIVLDSKYEPETLFLDDSHDAYDLYQKTQR